MVPEAAGRGQHFQARGHSFFTIRTDPKPANNLFIFCLRLIGLKVGLHNLVIELAGITCRPRTIVKNLKCQRTSDFNTRQRKMY